MFRLMLTHIYSHGDSSPLFALIHPSHTPRVVPEGLAIPRARLSHFSDDMPISYLVSDDFIVVDSVTVTVPYKYDR
jgi:hypothetical protein